MSTTMMIETTETPKALRARVLAALTTAMAAPYAAKQGPCGGCGRVYVTISGDRPTIAAFAAAAKKLGLIFQRKAYYGLSNALYIGYDNADGRVLARGEVVAAILTAAGIPAYSDVHGD